MFHRFLVCLPGRVDETSPIRCLCQHRICQKGHPQTQRRFREGWENQETEGEIYAGV